MPRSTGKTLDAWLRKQAARVRTPLTAAIGVGTFGGLLLVLQAWLLAGVVNSVIIAKFELPALWPSLFGLLGVFILRAVVNVAADCIAFEAGVQVALEVRSRLLTHIVSLGPAWTRTVRTGEVISAAVDGVENLRKYYDAYLPQMALAAAIPFTILVFVFPSDWISGIVMVIAAPLIPLFMIILGKGAETLNRRQWCQLARMGATFFDAIEGLTTLKLFAASRREMTVIAEVSEAYRTKTMAVLRVAFLSSLALEFLATVSIALIAVYIGFRLYFHEMNFLQGFFVLLLAPEFFRPLRSMGTQYHARMEAIGASEAIVELLEMVPIRAGGAGTLPLGAPLAIAFEEVGFAYRPGTPVIENVSFIMRRGERVALVGPSGVGKTTLSHLLLGFASPTAGHIRVDGIDLAELSREDWMKRIAWLPQRPTLFHGTLLDNVRLARPEASEDQVRCALESAGASAFVAALPAGLDTIVGDRGQGLSGGEIQRIALARVFLKNADVVVLDEASAGLDFETAALVTRSVERLSPGRALLIIAHRLETLRTVDRIVVLDRGGIVEQGHPDDLLGSASRYAGMVDILEEAEA